MWIYQPEKRIWREALNSHFIHCICQNDIYFVHYNDISGLKLKSLENTNVPKNRVFNCNLCSKYTGIWFSYLNKGRYLNNKKWKNYKQHNMKI